MSVTLTAEARARLDKHLDAVEAALTAAGNSREQRRGVVDDLEAQILDMLAARSQTPLPEDVEAVLGQLDPPGAYVSNAPTAPTPPSPKPVLPPRYSRTAIWGLVCIIVSLLPQLIMIPLALLFFPQTHKTTYSSPSTMSRPAEVLVPNTPAPLVEPEQIAATTSSAPASPTMKPQVLMKGFIGGLPCIACFTAPLGLLGTVLGWIGFFQIRNSKGALHGTFLALFDGLFYPCLAFVGFIVMLALA